MTVVPFKRGGGESPREAPQIDRETLVELLALFVDLSAHLKREPALYRRIELYGIANRLGNALQPFTRPTQPPKGAA